MLPQPASRDHSAFPKPPRLTLSFICTGRYLSTDHFQAVSETLKRCSCLNIRCLVLSKHYCVTCLERVPVAIRVLDSVTMIGEHTHYLQLRRE